MSLSCVLDIIIFYNDRFKNTRYLNYSIWDYHSSYELRQWKPDLRNHNLDLSYRSTPHLSAVELINSHDNALVLAGYNDGNIQVWSQCIDGPKLVTGWHALPIDKSPSFESSSSESIPGHNFRIFNYFFSLY